MSQRIRGFHGLFLFVIILISQGGFAADAQIFEDAQNQVILDSQDSRINYDANGVEHFTGQKLQKKNTRLSYSGFSNPESSRDELLNLKWAIGTYGSGIGLSNFELADHASPYPEIICGGSRTTFGSNSFWYIVSYNEETDDYTQKWVSDSYGSADIVRLLHEDMYSMGHDQILVVLDTGSVRRYDRQTRTEVSSFSTAIRANDAVIGDYNKDGSPDLFILSDSSLKIYDAISGTLLHTELFGGTDLAIGQMDSDPGMEIVIANNVQSIVWDIDTASQQWGFAADGFADIAVGDLDGDGMDEVVGMKSWSYIYAYDVDTEIQKWRIENFDNDTIHIGPYQAGGGTCVFVGDGQWGDVRCYDGANGTELWTIENPEHGVTDICLADVDRDGVIEIIWAAGHSSTGEDHMYVVDTVTQVSEWENIHLDPPFMAFDTGDLDNDDVTEIAVCSFESNSGYDNGYLMVYNGETYELELMNDAVPNDMVWVGIRDLVIADFDPASFKMEYIIGTAAIYDAKIWGYSYPTQSVIFQTSEFEGLYFNIVEVADVDSDGTLEMIGIVGVEHTGADGVYLFVFNALTGQLEWTSILLGAGFQYGTGLCVADIDGDSVMEIGAVVKNSKVYIFDGENHGIEWEHSTVSIATITFADIDPNTEGMEILFGTSNGDVYIYDGINKQYMRSIAAGDDAVKGIKCCNIDDDYETEILVGVDGYLKVYDPDGSELWTSHRLGSTAGYYGNIACDDIDNDGYQDVFISSDYKFFHFESKYVSTTPTPSPVPTFTPTPTHTPTSTRTPATTYTPTPTPTPEGTATPVNECLKWGCEVVMPSRNFHPGDICYCDVFACNPTQTIHEQMPVFIILDIAGYLLFAPGFTEMDFYILDLHPGETRIEVIPEFNWPAGTGTTMGVHWYAGITNQEMTSLMGTLGGYTFNWY